MKRAKKKKKTKVKAVSPASGSLCTEYCVNTEKACVVFAYFINT